MAFYEIELKKKTHASISQWTSPLFNVTKCLVV